MTEKRASIGARRNPATESAVLDAAVEIVEEQGIGALTMEAVARRARAGKATLYRWWPTRGALLLAVYQRQKTITSYPDTGTLEGDVKAFLDTLFAHWSRPEGGIFRHIVAASQGDDDVREALEAYRQDRLDSLSVLFERAVQRDELSDEVPPRSMAQAMMAMAWLYLLVNRLDADTGGIARTLVRGWTRP
ncbi:MAG: TetR family transcriptional regulator [Yangia sp.]|nr:TetR family transcriptional regulator [Salipiger sp.]